MDESDVFKQDEISAFQIGLSMRSSWLWHLFWFFEDRYIELDRAIPSASVVHAARKVVDEDTAITTSWAATSIFLRRRRSTTTTTESTAEAWLELARSTTLLARLASITTTVSTLTVTITSGTTTATRATLTVLTTHHAARRSMCALLLDVGSRDDLGGEMQPVAEVLETLGSQSVVVVLPREASLEVAAGGEGLAGFDDL